MVTGGRKTTPQVIELAFLIGQQVILKNHNLISNGAAGVDTASSEGALLVCRSKNLDPSVKIQVFRPRKAPTPHFEFGNLQIVGTDYDERRNFVVHKSDVVILLGGDKGTRYVARQAQIAGKPIIPLGIGAYDDAAVKLWYKIREQYIDNLPVIPIQDEDLQKIGPEQQDLDQVALSAVMIAERLAWSHIKIR